MSESQKLAVSELHVYPVKSCAGWTLDRAEAVATGFAHDREWMVADSEGGFITQRQYPKMALIRPSLSPEGLTLEAPGLPKIVVPIIEDGARVPVIVWESPCTAVDQGKAVSEWLSGYLGKECRLVRMAPEFQRGVKEKYRKSGKEVVGFADSMPFLLTSQASLDDLNSKLADKLPMDRFRPNIVVSGGAAFQEDAWKKIRIGSVVFRVSKACVRCEITTVDQRTGEKGGEPLETLGKYRTGPKGVMFGQNLIHENIGALQVDDIVEVIE